MEIKVAKTAGFCFGVARAVGMVEKLLEEGHGPIATLGPLIHNPMVIENLEAKGVRVIKNLSEALPGERVVIRSHGVGKNVYRELEARGLPFLEATCPYVARIQQLAREKTREGYFLIIMGDSNHPEVQGIVGHAEGKNTVLADYEEFENFFHENLKLLEKKVAIVAQTTYNIGIWDRCVTRLAQLQRDFAEVEIEVFPTICDATLKRQREAAELAAKVDLMIVLGGNHSSNTHKLYDICKKCCKHCVLAESAEDLKPLAPPWSGLWGEQSDFFDGAVEEKSRISLVGITAGASTPAYIIKEVQSYMSEFEKTLDEDFNFEEALEQSFKKIYVGNRVKGFITAINNNEAIVDVGTKHTGYVPFSELTDDSSLKPEDVVTVGEEIDLIVVKINDQEGIVTLSKKRIDAMVGFDSVMKAKDDGSVLEGNVIGVVKGGILVNCNGAKVFIPASQATQRRDDKLEELLKKNVKFKVLEVNEQRGRAVGSIRAVNKEVREEAEKKFWESVKVGDTFKGEIKSITSYGAFVDLGGIDGMVHISELSWNRIKHPSEVVSVGDMLEVYVKELDPEKNRISLGYKKEQDNPWELFKSQHQVGDTVKVTVVSITPFGAFAQIMPGIDGLIHISQLAVQRVNNVKDVLNVGQVVDVKITEIDTEKRRISLSIRALMDESDEGAEDSAE